MSSDLIPNAKVLKLHGGLTNSVVVPYENPLDKHLHLLELPNGLALLMDALRKLLAGSKEPVPLTGYDEEALDYMDENYYWYDAVNRQRSGEY
ncbi:MAG: hypothetical protein ACYS8W_07505 [Planctomycetota bacterium]